MLMLLDMGSGNWNYRLNWIGLQPSTLLTLVLPLSTFFSSHDIYIVYNKHVALLARGHWTCLMHIPVHIMKQEYALQNSAWVIGNLLLTSTFWFLSWITAIACRQFNRFYPSHWGTPVAEYENMFRVLSVFTSHKSAGRGNMWSQCNSNTELYCP